MDNDKKLFLLDAFALIYRAYFALNAFSSKKPNQTPGLVNSKGINTAAILGFTNTLVDLLQSENPTHIAVVFDSPGDTVRHEEFSGYKATREAMPDDIRIAIPYIQEIIKAFHIPILYSDGYEADDIIGTLAKKAEKLGYTTYMMTPDKDYAQLVSDRVFMFKPARSGGKPEVLGVKEVCEKYGLERPEQFIDILGMWGDAVDNIPGIPGVGEKTAMKLVQEYGSMENLYEHLDDLKGKLKENVENNREQAFLSKRLATIIVDAPVEFNEKDLTKDPPDEQKLHELFSELEFRTLSKRVLRKEIMATANGGQTSLFDNIDLEVSEEQESGIQTEEFATAENTKHDYVLADSKEKIEAMLKELGTEKEICFDTETTGLDPLTSDIIGLSFSAKKGKAWYVPVPGQINEIADFLKQFKPLFEDESKLLIAHNLKFDLKVLHKYGVSLKAKPYDTMIAHYLLQPDSRHNMDILSEEFLNYRPISIENLIGPKGKNQLNMKDVDLEKVKEYAAEDADVTRQLKDVFQKELEKEGIVKLFTDIEMPLVEVLASMEEKGIALDVPTLKEFSVELGKDIKTLEKAIHEMSGHSFNVDSPKQLGEVLFDEMKITDKIPKTKTGQYSTSEDVLVKLKNDHEIIEKILQYRSLKKLKSTYADKLPEEVNEKTGRVHTTYSQTIAATGRLSSVNPNLQNIPIKTERGREIRKAFVPGSDNELLLSADYSQIELRIIAALSKDEGMIEAFRNNEDIHSTTAAKIFGVDPSEVDRQMRIKAKAVNFGIIYGQGPFGLSQNLNISRSEAKEIIDNYFEKYGNILKYMEHNKEFAREHGYVETIMGRRRYLRDINSSNAVVRSAAERNAINAPIQGSAADIIKIAMINIHKAIADKKMKSKMLLQVHDELVFEVEKNELEVMKELVRDKMENAVKLDVPLTVEMNAATNWLDAH